MRKNVLLLIMILAFVVSLFAVTLGCGKDQSEAPPGGDQTEAVADSTGKSPPAADADSVVSLLKIDRNTATAPAVSFVVLSPAYEPAKINTSETSALTTIEHQNLKSSSNDLFAKYKKKAPAKSGDQIAAATPVTKHDTMNN